MWNLIKYIFGGIVVSSYYFSFAFTFLPESVNTKMMMAVIGLPLLCYNILSGEKKFVMVRELFIATVLALIFTIWCCFTVDYNGTGDYTYGSYIISYAVWLFAAYTTTQILKSIHGYLDLRLLTYYLAGISVAQCFLALLIDNVPIIQTLVNKYIYQAQDFLMRIGRLYGIGASLDNAGVRFSVVLVLIATMVVKDVKVEKSQKATVLLLLAFIIITGIGNIISRTTIVGSSLGLLYILLYSGIINIVIEQKGIKLTLTLSLLIALFSSVGVFFYLSSPVFEEYMRFAFEGFFNWAEKGEWTTSSTERLNSVMWIWPDPNDIKTWLIGQATFKNWYAVGTDIGYCRFIFYCGAIGFSIFIIFFIYNAWVLKNKLPQYNNLYLFLLAISFVVWIKVATDIFLIYALMYCLYDYNHKQHNDETVIR